MLLERSKAPNGKGYYLRIRDWIKTRDGRVKVTLKNLGFVSFEDKEKFNKWKEFVKLVNELNQREAELREKYSKEEL